MIKEAQLPSTISRRIPFWSSWRIRVRAPLILAALCVIASLLGVLYLNQSTRVSNLGYTLRSLNGTRDALRREIAVLKYEVARARSLSRIEERATRLGLVETVEVELLTVNRPANNDARASLPDRQSSPELAAYLPADIFRAWDVFKTWLQKACIQLADWLRTPRVEAKNTP